MVKRYQKKDPYFTREASTYDNPVVSREFIIQYLEEVGRPVTFEHLKTAFGIKEAEEKEGLRRRLNAMQRDGQLISNRRGSYGLVKKMELVRGVVQGCRDGFGFLIPDDGGNDIFLPVREMRTVFSNDVVLVRVTNLKEKRREGCIVEVLEQNTHQVVGRYMTENGFAFVDPDNKSMTQDILIPSGQAGNAKQGQFVVVEITSQPTKRRQAVGRVVDVLGDHLTPGMETQLAIYSYDIPSKWPEDVLREAKKFPAELLVSDKEGREDLRTLPFVTIDGEDAKDFDDAVYCEPNKAEGWNLYVAIADVAHYVKNNSALDEEAHLRGNSVYFPAKVIPMLPESLSNNLCSLKPKVDRLVVVCCMKINEAGCIRSYRFAEAIIHSQARLTYSEVAAMLEDKPTKHQKLLMHLKEFHKLYKKLQKQRILRGAIEFDKKGKIKRIFPLVRNDAHRMIEEAMLAANVSAAKWLQKENIPTLYRIHEGPEEQKLLALRDFLKAFGLRLTGGDTPSPMDYAKLLARIEKRPDAHLLQTVMLRSLRQAMYRAENVGHFGLSFEGYCHFTSPIRRYPDLIVHRGLKHLLHKKSSKKQFLYDEQKIVELGEHCSITERRADQATRDASDWLKCEYMLDKVGKRFDGRIVEVTGFGVFVQLNEIYVQGLLHITALQNDYYHHDPTHHVLRGKRSGQSYRLGDSIRVLVANVNLDERKIDFELAENGVS